MKNGNKTKTRWKILVLAVFMFLLLFIGVTAFRIWVYGEIDEKQQADAAIVLGAGAYYEQVSPVFRERLYHGIWLYQNDYVEKLILTGGMGKGNEYSDAFIAKQYVVRQGVPEADVLIEEQSTITKENLENAKEIMDIHSYDSAIIVSDPLHMKRAMVMAEDSGIRAFSSPTPTTRYVHLKSKLPFLMREVFFYIGYQVYRLF